MAWQLSCAHSEGRSGQSVRSDGDLRPKIGGVAVSTGQFVGRNRSARCETHEADARTIDRENTRSRFVHNYAEGFGRENRQQCHRYPILAWILRANAVNSLRTGSHVSRSNCRSFGHLHNGRNLVEYSAARASDHLDGDQFAVRLHTGVAGEEADWRLFNCRHEFAHLFESKRSAVRCEFEQYCRSQHLISAETTRWSQN